MDEVKNWWESKVVWLNILTFIVAALLLVAAPTFPVQIPEPWINGILGVVALLNLGLRFITSEPIK
jgi:hypothetical protein